MSVNARVRVHAPVMAWVRVHVCAHAYVCRQVHVLMYAVHHIRLRQLRQPNSTLLMGHAGWDGLHGRNIVRVLSQRICASQLTGCWSGGESGLPPG
jgi:hypothetical protein